MGNASPLIVETSAGTLRGITVAPDDDVRVFRGVPYAKPPVGELRWRPPEAGVEWTGIRDAATFSPPCWQTGGDPKTVYYKGIEAPAEDCLYLNLWTAARSADERRPVMVWFHGGGNVNGTGSTPNFDGTVLARKGVVLVTINYRLGPFGFLAHPALTAESGHEASGNFGLMDQVAALRWVQQNITAFGGDPDRVTIFGQSAGSWDVCALMVSPVAAGLFHRAIGQSGQCLRSLRPLDSPSADAESAHEAGMKAAAALNVSGEGASAIKKLRAMDAKTVFEAMRPLVSGYPVIDGWIIPESPEALFGRGDFNRVPLIIGTMAHETSPALIAEQTAESVQADVTERFPSRAGQILAAYRQDITRSPTEALALIRSDARQTREARRWAGLVSEAGGKTYLYYFAHRPPAYRIYLTDNQAIDVRGGLRGMGAYHSGDLVYVFGNVGRTGLGWEPHDHVVSDTVSDYWVNFAKTGDPNADGLSEWPAYSPATESTLIIAEEIAAGRHPRIEQLEAFAP